jgi:hypothetical protein
MLMSQPRDRGLIKIKCPAGTLIPKPSIGFHRQKWQKFYNWPKDKSGAPVEDHHDGPLGVERVVSVPRDAYHLRMLAKGVVTLADGNKKKGDK